jgi:hypothetical protein
LIDVLQIHHRTMHVLYRWALPEPKEVHILKQVFKTLRTPA